jgi:hypothetical protein
MAQKSDTATPAATMVCQEDGTPYSVTVSPQEGLVVRNGSTGTLAVSLPVKPSQSVTVKSAVIDGSGKLTVSAGASLTFTTGNYATPQNVTLQSTAAQAGWFSVLVAPSGIDVPGFAGVTAHVLVS